MYKVHPVQMYIQQSIVLANRFMHPEPGVLVATDGPRGTVACVIGLGEMDDPRDTDNRRYNHTSNRWSSVGDPRGMLEWGPAIETDELSNKIISMKRFILVKNVNNTY